MISISFLVFGWVLLALFYWAILYAHGERERELEVAS